MADEYVDPSGNTEQFRAFVQGTDAASEKPAMSRPLVIALVVAGVVVAAAVVAILAM